MEEKVIEMMIYYVLGVNNKDKQTIQECLALNKLLIAVVKNDKPKADSLLDTFPKTHPVAKIYAELRNREDLLKLLEISREKFENSKVDKECLKKFEDDSEVEELARQLMKGC